MDANLRETTVDLIEHLAETKGHYVWNDAKKYTNINACIKAYKHGLYDGLFNQISDLLAYNKNVIGTISEYKLAARLVKYIKTLFPEIKVYFYHGENDAEEEGFANHKEMK